KIIVNFRLPELRFSSQGNFLAVTKERDPMGYLFNCRTGRAVKTFDNLTFFRFRPDETALFTDEGQVIHWDPRTGRTIHSFGDVHAIDLSPDGETLLAKGADGKLYLLEMNTKKTRSLGQAFFFWQSAIRAAFSPDNKTLVTYSGVELAIWDTASGKQR